MSGIRLALQPVREVMFPFRVRDQMFGAMLGNKLHVFARRIAGKGVAHVVLGGDGKQVGETSVLPITGIEHVVPCGDLLVMSGWRESAKAPAVFGVDAAGAIRWETAAVEAGLRVYPVCVDGRAEVVLLGDVTPGGTLARLTWMRAEGGAPVTLEEGDIEDVAVLGSDQGMLLLLIVRRQSAELVRVVAGRVEERRMIAEGRTFRPRLVRNGDDVVALWLSDSQGGDRADQVMGQRLRFDLSPLGPARVLVTNPNRSRRIVRVDLITNGGGRSALTWVLEAIVDIHEEPIRGRGRAVALFDPTTGELGPWHVRERSGFEDGPAGWIGDHLLVLFDGFRLPPVAEPPVVARFRLVKQRAR